MYKRSLSCFVTGIQYKSSESSIIVFPFYRTGNGTDLFGTPRTRKQVLSGQIEILGTPKDTSTPYKDP